MKVVQNGRLSLNYSHWLRLMDDPFDLLRSPIQMGDFLRPRIRHQRAKWHHPYSTAPSWLKHEISREAWNKL